MPLIMFLGFFTKFFDNNFYFYYYIFLFKLLLSLLPLTLTPQSVIFLIISLSFSIFDTLQKRSSVQNCNLCKIDSPCKIIFVQLSNLLQFLLFPLIIRVHMLPNLGILLSQIVMMRQIT